jgi:hypothetical protein
VDRIHNRRRGRGLRGLARRRTDGTKENESYVSHQHEVSSRRIL